MPMASGSLGPPVRFDGALARGRAAVLRTRSGNATGVHGHAEPSRASAGALPDARSGLARACRVRSTAAGPEGLPPAAPREAGAPPGETSRRRTVGYLRSRPGMLVLGMC